MPKQNCRICGEFVEGDPPAKLPGKEDGTIVPFCSNEHQLVYEMRIASGMEIEEPEPSDLDFGESDEVKVEVAEERREDEDAESLSEMKSVREAFDEAWEKIFGPGNTPETEKKDGA